jgi:two-component system, OmpR family, sensor histidine kinase VicK
MMTTNNPALHYFQALVQGCDQIFFAYEIASQKISLLNPAFEKVWHKTRKSVMRDTAALLKTIHPGDKQHVVQVYQQLLAGAIIKELEFRIVLSDKSVRWVCVKPQLLKEESVLIGSADDITAQKDYNDYLKKFSDKKNSILNILSHDLAGPLAMINSLSHMLEEDLRSPGNEELHKVVGMIEKTSKQSMQLMQEFINLEFLESTSLELIKRRVNLVGAIKEIMQEYQSAQQKLGKTFHFLPASDTIYLDLDDNKFMQVINNLISNAIKFTPDGGEITVALEEKEESVLVTVADTGIGIPDKFQDSLFEKFTKARRPGIKGEPSVGLGMSIIKTIVEWHHGHIWFESKENEGTTFYIQVPKT